jgi:hypothetical protein
MYNPKLFLALEIMIRVVHLGYGSCYFSHPGSRIQGSKGHRIRIRNTEAWAQNIDAAEWRSFKTLSSLSYVTAGIRIRFRIVKKPVRNQIRPEKYIMNRCYLVI